MIDVRILAALVLAPSAALAQLPLAAPASSVTFSYPAYQSPPKRSPAKTIALHTAVGTGAGLLTGLLLSGASTSDDRTTVVVTWTALGAAAGLVSGVVTSLLQR